MQSSLFTTRFIIKRFRTRQNKGQGKIKAAFWTQEDIDRNKLNTVSFLDWFSIYTRLTIHWWTICIFILLIKNTEVTIKIYITGLVWGYRPLVALIKGLCIMTSSNGNIFRVTGHLCGKFTGSRWIPTQRPVTRIFDVYFDLRPNKRLSKQSWGWWFETVSPPLWRHRNGYGKCVYVTTSSCADRKPSLL